MNNPMQNPPETFRDISETINNLYTNTHTAPEVVDRWFMSCHPELYYKTLNQYKDLCNDLIFSFWGLENVTTEQIADFTYRTTEMLNNYITLFRHYKTYHHRAEAVC